MSEAEDYEEGQVDLDFEADIDTPEHGSDFDWDAYHNYLAETIGLGKKARIGVISVAYELGIQSRPEKFVGSDQKGYEDMLKKLEKNDKGEQKDPSAYKTTREFKGKDVEGIAYQPKECPQIAFAIDFPELVVNPNGDENGGYPFRVILGERGWLELDPVTGRMPYRLAGPLNITVTNVNANNPSAGKLWAIPHQNLLHKMADWAGKLDPTGSIIPEHLPRLVGKRIAFDLDLEWKVSKKTGRKNLVIDARPTGRLMDAMDEVYKLKYASMFPASHFAYLSIKTGVHMSKSASEEDIANILKETRKKIVATMQAGESFSGSKLEEQFAKFSPDKLEVPDLSGSDSSNAESSESSQKASNESKSESKATTQHKAKAAHTKADDVAVDPDQQGDDDDDMDDDIPF